MTETTEGLLAAGAEAAGKGDWKAARESYAAVLEDQPVAEALFGLSDALWWLGELEDCIEYRQRAYVAFRERPDPAQAALCALLLCFDFRKQIGNPAAADGWLERAGRLVAEHGIDELKGWLMFGRSFDNDDPAAGERWARAAYESARESGDRDLELCALSEIGLSLVRQSRIKDGIDRLDEAMAAALGGEGGPETVVVASCNMMLACSECAAFERAVQWIQATDRFTERFGCPFLYAECRLVFGEVLLATGEWQRAEEELRAAIASTRGSVPALHRQSLAALAELRLSQGRVEEAQRLAAQCSGRAETDPVWASIELAKGNPGAAAAIARRGLDALGEERPDAARLVELLGVSEIALREPQRAAARARRLIRLGRDRGCEVVTCRGERLLGRSLAASGDSEAARTHIESALAGFNGLDMAPDAARTRALLAEAARESHPDVCRAEAQTAFSELDRLGAAPDADRMAELLRSFGLRAARLTSRRDTRLTRREQQVLTLLGEGHSNPGIAARLHLSRKTVEHHVSRVLAKLGVRSRAEAAAEAVRLEGRSEK